MTQGRVICRLVAMFQSTDELVDENDRRRGLELDEEEADAPIVEPTLEYVLSLTFLSLPHHRVDRQNRTFRGYNLLARHVPGFESKLVDLEVPQLSVFFRDV